MLFKTWSASVFGIEAHLVDVEVNLTTGNTNGSFSIVGLPDPAVRESRNRVIAAIRNNGFVFPYQNITVNLAPADIKKEGSAFDLPMALAILGGAGLLQRQDLSDYLLVGELSLDGKLRPVRGVLSIAMLAREKKIPCRCGTHVRVLFQERRNWSSFLIGWIRRSTSSLLLFGQLTRGPVLDNARPQTRDSSSSGMIRWAS